MYLLLLPFFTGKKVWYICTQYLILCRDNCDLTVRDDGHEKQGADQQEDRKTDDKAKEIGEREYRRIDDTSKETVFSPIIGT